MDMDASDRVHRPATRRVPLLVDQQGNPYFMTVKSPVSFTPRALCIPPKRAVIPLIFVPGIMGSNLRDDKTKKAAWRPPNGLGEKFSAWWNHLDLENKDRQINLNPATTEVDPTGKIVIPEDCFTLDIAEAKRRGWGEVYWESYGGLLLDLERTINDWCSDAGQRTAQILPAWQTAQTLQKGEKDVTELWNPVSGACPPLTEAEFWNAAEYYYPVHACGYNWLQSNEQSAEHLVTRIDEVLAFYEQSRYFVPEGRVILISHSMGGLVTRRAAQLAEDKIIGVVHGVQPVGGAPVVYRRFRAGTEHGGFWDIKSKMTATILGNSASAITCVMANSPGPLELLPTKHYPPGWLRFEHKSRDGVKELMPPLPVSDPYTEIYTKRVQDVWWGMVDEKQLDPAKLAEKDKTTPLEKYRDNLLEATNFHDTLKLHFHPRTYAHYGSDKKQAAFGAVRWQTGKPLPQDLRESLPGLIATQWTEYGEATLGATRPADAGLQRESPDRLPEVRPALTGGVDFALAGYPSPAYDHSEDAGDGTVPNPSADLVDKAGLLAAFRLKGFDHQNSYGNANVLDNVTWCLGKLVQYATPADQLVSKSGKAPTCEPDAPSSTDSSPASSLEQSS